MNKKGFTLIEICISVALLSVVMIFLLSFLSYIKTEDTGIEEDTSILLNKAIVSKTINGEFMSSGQIESVVCENNSCDITFILGRAYKIELVQNVLTFKDTLNNKIILKREMPVEYNISYYDKATVHIIALIDPYDNQNNIEIISRKS